MSSLLNLNLTIWLDNISGLLIKPAEHVKKQHKHIQKAALSLCHFGWNLTISLENRHFRQSDKFLKKISLASEFDQFSALDQMVFGALLVAGFMKVVFVRCKSLVYHSIYA